MPLHIRWGGVFLWVHFHLVGLVVGSYVVVVSDVPRYLTFARILYLMLYILIYVFEPITNFSCCCCIIQDTKRHCTLMCFYSPEEAVHCCPRNMSGLVWCSSLEPLIFIIYLLPYVSHIVLLVYVNTCINVVLFVFDFKDVMLINISSF